MSDFNFDELVERIKNFKRHQLEEADKQLAEVITKYDFLVGSKDLQGTLGKILPKEANIGYSPYIQDPTSVYLIKRFDITDYLPVSPNFDTESEEE